MGNIKPACFLPSAIPRGGMSQEMHAVILAAEKKINIFCDPYQVTVREKGEVQGCQEENKVTSQRIRRGK